MRKMKRLLLAILIPAVVLGAIEGVLALFDVASLPTTFLVKEKNGEQRHCANPRHPFWGEPFIEVCVSAKKKPGTYRVFVVGESTANGYPYTRSCSPARWLQVRLEQLHPGRSFEVVRLSASGRQATDLVPFCEEVLAFEPDLIVLYSGHNEFFIEYVPLIKHPTQAAVREFFFRFRTARALARVLAIEPTPPLDPLADRRAIADVPYLTAEDFAYGEQRYRRAIRSIRELCAARGTDLVICLPACNLKDYQPTYSYFSAGVPAADRERARALLEEARKALQQNDPAKAEGLLATALAIDSNPALLHYFHGRALLATDRARALTEFELAKNLDDYPVRMHSNLLDVLREQERDGAILADCVTVFAQAAEDGIPGLDLFVDHCHPELAAQNLIITAVLQAMAKHDLLAPAREWHFEKEPGLAEYHRRMQLSLADLATDFSATAIHSLLNRLNHKSRPEAAETADRAFKFALRYDPQNGTARLGESLSAYVFGHLEEAKRLAHEAVARDPRLRHHARTFAKKYPELKDLFAEFEPATGD